VSTEGVIAAGVMVVIGLIWLAYPLLRRKSSTTAQELARQKERAALLTTYERTLASIRDLDDDHLTGKLSESDYEAERGQFAEQGVAVLQELEKHGIKKPSKSFKVPKNKEPLATNNVDPDAQLDDAIEQAIAAYIESTH
jgi:hypothetical protein